MSSQAPRLTPIPPTEANPETDELRISGSFICDSDGRKIAVLLDKSEFHQSHLRRLAACMKAMRGIPTESIESVLEGADSHLLAQLVNRHLEHEETIRRLQEALQLHRFDIAQLRETLRAAHAYEIQRAALARAPGAEEYMALCHALGIGRTANDDTASTTTKK